MHVEYCGTKFFVEKYSRLEDGRTAVRFVEDGAQPNPFKVEATSSGVNFSGSLRAPVNSRSALQDFARLIADAWKEHVKLAPKISKTGVIE